VPFIILCTGEEKEHLLLSEGLIPWDIVSEDELRRLPLSVKGAVEYTRAKAGLKQARNLLVSSQKSIAVGRLLGSIAHEINNPLEAVSNLLYLATRNISDPEVSDSLKLAEEELQRVSDITKQMWHFHRDSRNIQDVLIADILERCALSLQTAHRRSTHLGGQAILLYRSHSRASRGVAARRSPTWSRMRLMPCRMAENWFCVSGKGRAAACRCWSQIPATGCPVLPRNAWASCSTQRKGRQERVSAFGSRTRCSQNMGRM